MRNDIIFGCSMQNDTLPEWERVIHAAAHLQHILPEAVLVGGTASALYADHRLSTDADHVLTDLRKRFDDILTQLESVSGPRTARITRPVQILGSLDGIETGVRQLIRQEPLETIRIDCYGVQVTVPTIFEMVRIKGVLILKRNATRDYLDFAALADRLGDEGIVRALRDFDRLYPQQNEESALQQLQIQLSTPMPYDLDQMNLTEYKNIAPQWKKWTNVKTECARCAILIFDRITGIEDV